MATEVPLDVQILIIEWVFRSFQHTSIDYTTLRTCALVCRAWTPTAQRLLLRRIRCTSLQDRGNIPLLLRTLRTRPQLVPHVRHIAICEYNQAASSFRDLWLQLLELCRHIDVISFVNWNAHHKPLGADLEAHPQSIPLSPAVLRFSGNDDLESIHSVVNMCSSARMIVVDDSIAALPPTIEALEMSAGNARRCLSHSQPLPALRYLCLIRPSWTSTLSRHLTSAGILPQLQSLQIRGDFPPQKLLSQLTQLKTLVVYGLPVRHVTLPTSLRHVGYHAWGDAPPGASAELAVDPLRALPELQLVTVTRYVERHVQAALGTMCRDRSVDFARYQTPYAFQLAGSSTRRLDLRRRKQLAKLEGAAVSRAVYDVSLKSFTGHHRHCTPHDDLVRVACHPPSQRRAASPSIRAHRQSCPVHDQVAPPPDSDPTLLLTLPRGVDASPHSRSPAFLTRVPSPGRRHALHVVLVETIQPYFNLEQWTHKPP
ncbi:hypothetical protein FA95DRAFT_1611010 [Auriscalpium vulgare]|uniref:Uncharacterized protein n=1 Tax=Auriscalpium vulgare TaxID=40419 RepID=A0ACB8RBV1_9AGAM|nr:hypothetical protein FA95DRAFT_1611010 [Auriscalpium vulgare]